MDLILGSKSIHRRQLLEKAGLSFSVMSADIDEKAIRSDNYQELPLLIARAKANSLLPNIYEPAILITSDQVVVCNGELREKPETKEQAYYYLSTYSENHAQTITAVVVTNTTNNDFAEAVDLAKIHFKTIPDTVIRQIVEEGMIFNAAGGFIIQDPLLIPYIDHIEKGKERKRR